MTFPRCSINFTIFCNNNVEQYIFLWSFFHVFFRSNITKNEPFEYVKIIISIFNKAMHDGKLGIKCQAPDILNLFLQMT